MNETIYYHFTGAKLRDGKPIPPIGEWLVFDGHPIPCRGGLHASPDAFSALQYAPGEICHQVHLGGEIVSHGTPVDKYAAQKRCIIASIDATDIMRLYTRRVALDVIHLWDAPPIMREFLETGDESKRWAARDAARAAWDVRDTAQRAAHDAAWAGWDAAWDAARDAARAARDAARAAGDAARDAGDAARDAARAAKQKLYRRWFNKMVEAAFASQAVKP